jgi:hypothetical protein
VTAASFFRDITAFSVQIAVVGLGLAVLMKLVKIPAGVRLFGLRLALVAALVVPWLLRAPEAQAPALVTAATPAASLVPFPASGAPTEPEQGAIAAEPSKPPAIPWTQVGFGALLFGIAARIVWLGMGVLRLFRLQRGNCRCGERLPLLERFTFSFRPGEDVQFYLGQCDRCLSMLWADS